MVIINTTAPPLPHNHVSVDGVMVQNIQAVNDGLTATFVIDAAAPAGAREATVETAGGVSMPMTFSVTSARHVDGGDVISTCRRN